MTRQAVEQGQYKSTTVYMGEAPPTPPPPPLPPFAYTFPFLIPPPFRLPLSPPTCPRAPGVLKPQNATVKTVKGNIRSSVGDGNTRSIHATIAILATRGLSMPACPVQTAKCLPKRLTAKTVMHWQQWCSLYSGLIGTWTRQKVSHRTSLCGFKLVYIQVLKRD